MIGLRIGADDFIRKPFSQRVLVERVRTVLRRSAETARQRKTGSNLMERGHLRIDRERYICTWKGKEVALTLTEFRLVEALATRFGVVSFLNTITVFGTPNDVTLAELALEMLFPADQETIAIVRRMVEESELRAQRKLLA